MVASRPGEYTTAARATNVVGRTAAIEVDDLSLNDVEQYLQASIPKTRTAEWGVVFGHLRTNPEEAASRNLIPVLTTPLMVMLARTTYNDTPERTPQELLDTDRFTTPTHLEEHLLDAYLNTVYDPRRKPGPNSGTPPTWNPDRARRWLGYLATHLQRRNTHDLTWWQLPSTLHRHTRILTTTLTYGLATVLADVLTYGLATVLTFRGLAGGLATVLTVGLTVGLINEAGFFRGRTGREPERLRLRWRSRAQRSPRTYLKKAASQFTSMLAVGLVFGLAFGLATVLADVLADVLVFGLTDGLTQLAVGLDGLAFGLAFGLATVVVSVLADNQDPQDAISPWQLLTTDRTVTYVRTLVVVLVVGLVYELTFGARVYVVTDGLANGLAAGLARLVVSAWGEWLLFTRLWLPLTRRLPWRPKRFLEDAYRRGVLRQAGAVYQFRHAQLRDHLAHRYQTTPQRTPTTPASTTTVQDSRNER